MPDGNTLSLARDAVTKLLSALGIVSVVCVDDVYARELNIDDLLEAQAVLTEQELRTLFGKPDDVFPDDRVARRQSFREAWAALSRDEQQTVGAKIIAMKAERRPDDRDDFVASSALAEIVGAERLKVVRPAEWNTVKENLKAEQATGRTLLLFDQDLSNDGGGPAGITLATEVLNDDAMGDRVMCGLLTHTATIETQHDRWKELAQPPLDQDRFVVIAKGWLSRDPLGFARMLKQVALLPNCRAMKKRSKELLDAATADAQKKVDEIHIDDFESMVFRVSKFEGLWEPDMLFRLYGIFHRSAVRERAYTDGKLTELATKLRLVSDIPTHSPTATPLSTWKIQRQEMYEEGQYINALHLPIEVGDIFARTTGTTEKYYILLGQPCDLMVRSDGKRSPDSTDVILAEIFATAERKEHTIAIPHFSDDMAKKFYVRLRPAHSVNPCVLDLCVYNKEGISQLNVDDPCPDNMLPAWKLKHQHLKNFAQAVLRRYETFGHQKVQDAKALAFIKSESPKQFPIFTSNSLLFKGTMTFERSKRRLSFNCKRVKRLHRSRALAIALEYSQFLSRPAFDRDLVL